MTRRLGNYELLKRIGRGGMAEVWMGRRATLGGATKAVAVKVLAEDLSRDRRYRRMFSQEARLSMMLNHSNIVQVFDVGQHRDQCYLVMEWVDGLNLAQLCQLQWDAGLTLTFEVVGYVVGEVLRGLGYAHALTSDSGHLGIIHRDVSPQNVLVSVSGEIKLADFGVARLVRDESSGMHVKGKLRYMAPEQAAGRSLTARADLYAVGAILHELLDGRKFREGQDERQMFGQIVGGAVPELRREGVPAPLLELRDRLLDPDPETRLGSAELAVEQLFAWPGYRNTAVEVARLCRMFIGVDAPRSSLYAGSVPGRSLARNDTVTPQPSESASVDTSTWVAPAAAGAAVPVASGGGGDDRDATDEFGARARRWLLGAGVGTAAVAGYLLVAFLAGAPHEAKPGAVDADASAKVVDASPQVEEASARVADADASRPASGSLSTVAASSAASRPAEPPGMAPAPGGSEQSAREAETSDTARSLLPQTEASPVRDQVAVPLAATPPVGRPADVAGPTVAGVLPGSSGASDPDAGQPPARGAGRSAKANASPAAKASAAKAGASPPPRVAVRFQAEYPVRAAYVRVEGKELALQPMVEGTLPAGRVRVQWRHAPTDPWATSVVRLVAGKSYELAVARAAGGAVGLQVRPMR